VARRGFSILELLVSIAVIAVLLGITLPALFGARRSALELAAMAHQREVGALVRQHGFDREDTFPYFGVPGTDRAVLCLAPDDPRAGQPAPDGFPPCGETDYWDQPWRWAIHLRFLGYDTAFVGRPPELERANGGRPVLLGTIDFLTFGAFATPSYFTPGDPQDVSDHRAQRWASVAFPSDKVVLQRPNVLRERDDPGTDETFSWFADGHVEMIALSEMGPAVTIRNYLFTPRPGLSTLGGLSGRDRSP